MRSVSKLFGNLFRWQHGRQGTGYDKMLLATALWPIPFDSYLIRYPEGAAIPPHTDPVAKGRHYRLNIVLKPSLLGLVVQSDRSLIGYTEPVPVANEKTVRLEVEIVVPESPSMELITPLYVNGAERTNILDIRHFKIVGKQG